MQRRKDESALSRPGSPRSGRIQSAATTGGPDTPTSLFMAVDGWVTKRRIHTAAVREAEDHILKVYQGFNPKQRLLFLTVLYDRFSENYDHHMGVETNHYAAIRRVLQYAMPYLRPPVLDLTAGTGEPLKYALEFMDAAMRLQFGPLSMLVPEMVSAETGLKYVGYANEISPKMLGIAEKKLGNGVVAFTSHSAYELPPELLGRFNTVLCSQTFHLIADEDKFRLALALRDSLAPGGVAIVIEEDPFMISQTDSIDAVGLFLRSIVRPIKMERLAGRIGAVGLTRLDESASAPIDDKHVMKLNLFVKPL